MRTVLFHRNFQHFQGGHLKVFHYFEHVRSSPSQDALIRFSRDSVWDPSNPWLNARDAVIDEDQDAPDVDALFLAGMDWRWVEPEQRVAPRLPIFNLIQGRHARRDNEVRKFLAHPAIRICIGPEIQDELESFGVEGPIFTIPIGVDLELLPAPLPAGQRDIDCLVLGVKDRPLGQAIARRLGKAGHRVLLVDQPIPRKLLLENMARARVAVHLPLRAEGAYLPALESMALGAVVVCPDCIGNRSFCRDGDTSLVPERTEKAITAAALTALSASDGDLRPMLAAARDQSDAHALTHERTRFLELLERVDELWPVR
jgi:hypothetical protein